MGACLDIFKSEKPKVATVVMSVARAEMQPILMQPADTAMPDPVGTDLTSDHSWTIQELKNDYEFMMQHERMAWVDHELLALKRDTSPQALTASAELRTTADAAGLQEIQLEKQMGMVLNEMIVSFQQMKLDKNFATPQLRSILTNEFYNVKPLADAVSRQALDYARTLHFSWSKSSQAQEFLTNVAIFCFKLMATQDYHALELRLLEDPNASNDTRQWQPHTNSSSLTAPSCIYPALLCQPQRISKTKNMDAETCPFRVVVCGLFAT